jgi:hypothetical protein
VAVFVTHNDGQLGHIMSLPAAIAPASEACGYGCGSQPPG